MKRASPLAIAATALLAACGAAAAERDALAAFEHFQTALFAGDAAALLPLVTRESRDAVAGLPLGRVAGQQPLVAVGCQRQGNEHWVTVRDPNQGDHRSVFVVAREDGRLVIDLLATAAHQATWTPTTAPPPLEPRPLSPQELERARSLATPNR